MGKKNSVFKNIMITLGCTAFAGTAVLGGGAAVCSYMGIESEIAKPSWLDRVEIHVDNANASAAASAQSSDVLTDPGSGNNVRNSGTNGNKGDDEKENENKSKKEEKETEIESAEEEQSAEEEETERGADVKTKDNSEEDSEESTEENSDDETDEETDKETDKKSDKESDKETNKETNKNSDKNSKEDTKNHVQVDHVQVLDEEDAPKAVITDVSAVVETAMPCLVSIKNEYTSYDYWYDEEYDETANGSGIIVAQNDEELLIVTNYHVVEDNKNLYVQFIDDKEVTAYVKGQSPENDLAIVSVFLEDMSDSTLEKIAIAALGDSDELQVGEPAIAIGDSLGYGQSVTTGVISALNRDIFAEDPDFNPGYLIQTDAAINPGNSGGALLNIRGEVVGINSSKIADYVIEGMGYAIPISTAKPIIEDLMQKETRKKVPSDERAFLGIAGTDVTEDAIERYEMPEGVYVSNVLEDTAADKAGILKGDIITYIDGEKIAQMTQLQSMLEYYASGTEVEVVLMRQKDGEYKQKTVSVTLGVKEE